MPQLNGWFSSFFFWFAVGVLIIPVWKHLISPALKGIANLFGLWFFSANHHNTSFRRILDDHLYGDHPNYLSGTEMAKHIHRLEREVSTLRGTVNVLTESRAKGSYGDDQ